MIIYCDMDGVLCDFERQWARTSKMPFSKFSSLNMHDRWEPVRKHGGYWSTMPWKGDGRMLWNYIKKYDVRILSAYSSSDPNCMLGKRQWLQKNVSISSAKIHLVKRVEKQQYAKKNTILIDDYAKNIREFKARGGEGIRHKTASQTISELKKLGL
jgi:5'(3')-deoxyribonucleotidase